MKKLFLLITLLITANFYGQDSVFVDCNGTPAPENWLGDGWCDDGAYTFDGNPIFFDCEEFGYDGGDCPLPIDTVFGCTNDSALNFDSLANTEDFSCEFPIFGCTDPEAPNYNPWAEADNDSCIGLSCSDGEVKMILELTLDQYPSETGWILTDISNGQAVESVTAGEYNYNQANQTIIYDLCVPTTGVELILSDIYGDGLQGSLFGGTDGNFVILGDVEPCGSLDTLWSLEEPGFGNAAYSGPIWLESCDIPAIEGCTNNSYIEYNINANLDDGSCENLHTLGCINPEAYNYNPEATLNEIFPTCNYTLVIEDDGGDGWGDSYIGVVQEDSIIGTYTMGPGPYSQEFGIQLETDKPVKVYYFEIANPQTPLAEVAFQTMHNSFKLINSDGIVTLQGGVYPFADNGAGALQSFEPPFWNVYSAFPFCGDYCIPKVFGCTDETGLNYNPSANTDDGSCIEIIIGCTNDLAFNYNSEANIDDGSCQPVVYGCMDDIAWNYNFLANIEDGSCLYFGCTDDSALNYDESANVDNGACIYPILGCTDPLAFNFDVDANTNDGSCIPVLIGCMDPTMWNYNEEANTESDNCIPFIFGCTDTTAFNYDPVANTDNGSCIPVTPGCTDPEAFNYNADANIEDFSCIDVVLGCTDPEALNYDSSANTDNGSCIETLEGCMDETAYNYDPIVNLDNGSCLYDAECVGDPGDPYWLNDSCYAWVINVDPSCCDLEWDIKCEGLYDYCQIQNGLDIEELLKNSDVIIYPNPSSDILNIATNVRVDIEVFDIMGNLVIRIKENQLNIGMNQLDISQLASGLYNFVITYDGKAINKKVIKQ